MWQHGGGSLAAVSRGMQGFESRHSVLYRGMHSCGQETNGGREKVKVREVQMRERIRKVERAGERTKEGE